MLLNNVFIIFYLLVLHTIVFNLLNIHLYRVKLMALVNFCDFFLKKKKSIKFEV